MHRLPLPAIAIETDVDWNEALAYSESGLAIIYKHSPVCGLSEMALEHMLSFEKVLPKHVKLFFIDVISARATSRKIEAVTGIIHESPQVLFLRNRHCVWNASHRAINKLALTSGLASAIEKEG